MTPFSIASTPPNQAISTTPENIAARANESDAGFSTPIM